MNTIEAHEAQEVLVELSRVKRDLDLSWKISDDLFRKVGIDFAIGASNPVLGVVVGMVSGQFPLFLGCIGASILGLSACARNLLKEGELASEQARLMGRFQGLQSVALDAANYLTSHQSMTPEAMKAVNDLLS